MFLELFQRNKKSILKRKRPEENNMQPNKRFKAGTKIKWSSDTKPPNNEFAKGKKGKTFQHPNKLNEPRKKVRTKRRKNVGTKVRKGKRQR